MNSTLGYIALILAQAGTSAKQYAMKVCGKRAPGAFNSVCINMLRSAICLIVSLVIWLISGMGTTNFTGHIIIIFSGIGTAIGLFVWILASRLVSLTLIDSLSMIGSMVLPMVLAPYIYKGESVSPMQWVGCALVFVAVFLFMKKDTSKKEEASPIVIFLILFFNVLGTSVTTILKKYYTFYFTSNELGTIEYFTFISFVTVLVFFAIFFAICVLKEKRSSEKTGEVFTISFPFKAVRVFVLIAAAALYVNELFTVYAQGNLESAVYLPLAKGLTVAGTFLLDLAFGDKLTLKKVLGLIAIIAAIILVNL